MRVLLDTQVFVLLIGTPDGNASVPPVIRELVTDPKNELCFSAVSINELAIKYSVGKLNVSAQIMRESVHHLNLTLLPYTPQHALRLYELPLHHKDPFDRQLIATALTENIPLVSGDRQFARYEELQVIW